jgi:hypothetical protein
MTLTCTHLLVLAYKTQGFCMTFSMYQAKDNASLQDHLERKKQELHERRVALEQDVRT